jgi:hypothetical protein
MHKGLDLSSYIGDRGSLNTKEYLRVNSSSSRSRSSI